MRKFFVTPNQKIRYFYIMRSTVSILFYLKYGSRSVDGRLPLMCRITIDGESTSFSCKMRVPPEKWDARQNALVGDDEESEQTNRMIDELRQQLLSAYTGILHEYGSVRPKWLKEYTMGTPSRQEMLLFFFSMHNENFRTQVGHGRARKTYQRYTVVYSHLRSFLQKHYQLDDVRIKYVTLAMVTAFEQYLRVDRKLKNNTVWAYMITFKHIISLARVHGLIRSDPFAGYKNHFEQVDRGYLTEPELQRLMLLPLEEGTQRRVRDLFVFSAFTGLSYADIRALRWENIRTLFDGKTWIVTRRRKTGTPSNIPLLAIPKKILDHYGHRDADPVFDIPSNNCCNEYLNTLGQRCGIRFRLSFHIARHTFATLSLSKGMPIETLSNVMGHTNIRTTQIYAKITNQKISEDMSQLGDKINNLEGPVI